LGVCATPSLLLAQESAQTQPAGSNSVSGIFAGMNVGGSRRHALNQSSQNSLQKRGSADSFAVNPSDYASELGGASNQNQNRVQSRQLMVPGMETRERVFPPPSAAPAAEPAEAAPASEEAKEVEADSVGRTVQDVQSLSAQTTNQASEDYYNGLIDQVRGKSDQAAGISQPKSKYSVTQENKF